jgi:hypothetical protein
MFAAVDDRGRVRPFVWVDPDDEHAEPSSSEVNAAAGTPDVGMPFLFRATPQQEHRHDGPIVRKPTQTRQGILETTAGTLDATN